MTEYPQPTEHAPDEILTLTVRDGENGGWVVDVWQREGRSGADLAKLLRQIAAGFAQGEVKRIR